MKTKQILKTIGIMTMVLSLGWMVVKCAYGVGLAEGYRKGIQEYETPNSRNIQNLLKNINLTIEDAEVYFDEIDELVKNGTNEDDAVEVVFDKHENNPFGDVSTLMDYYNIYNGEYDDNDDLMACERALDALQDKYSEDIKKAFQEGKESILEQF